MLFRVKTFVIIGAVLVTSYISWNTYHYFLSTDLPTVQVSGLDEGGAYCGDVQCIISGTDRYKIADVSVWLDGRP